LSCDTVSELFYQLNQQVLNKQWRGVEKIVYQIAQIGHTSGRDTLFGMLLAIQHVTNNMRSNNNEK
uniref:oxamate carbamoyltransferase subunit AllH family protein n=2 Tax=Streptococcus TaxID=1301 RepID=UPI00128FD485